MTGRGARRGWTLALLSLAGCAHASPTTGAAPALEGSAELAPPPFRGEALPVLDLDRYRSVLIVDAETLRRIDPQAPRDELVEDVLGGDPLLRALLPDAFSSLSDVRWLEYRAHTFAGSRWGLLVQFERALPEALAARGLELPPGGAPAPWPADRPSVGASLDARSLLLSPRAAFEEELRDVGSRAPVELAPRQIAAWRLTHVDEDFRGREAALPRELLLGAFRATAPAVIRLEVRARYADAASAERGLHHWEGLRARLVENPFVGLIGMDRPLAERSVRLEGEELAFVTTLRAEELRFVLGAMSGMHHGAGAGDDGESP